MTKIPKEVQDAYFEMMAHAEPLLAAALELAGNGDPTNYWSNHGDTVCYFCHGYMDGRGTVRHKDDCEWTKFQVAAGSFGFLRDLYEWKVCEHGLYWELLGSKEEPT